MDSVEKLISVLSNVEGNLLVLPLAGAFIGWLTNFIAVKMLFHPNRESHFRYLSVQGVFPKRQKAFARKLGEIVSNELFSIEDVAKKLANDATSPEVLDIIMSRIESAILRKLPAAMPMAALFINADLIEKMKAMFREDLQGVMREIIEELSGRLRRDLDV